MNAFRIPRKYRTRFGRLVTDGDDEVEPLSEKVFHRLRTKVRRIYSVALFQGRPCQRMNCWLRQDPGTVHVSPSLREMAQQHFGHLRSGCVARAEKQNPESFGHRILLCSRSGSKSMSHPGETLAVTCTLVGCPCVTSRLKRYASPLSSFESVKECSCRSRTVNPWRPRAAAAQSRSSVRALPTTWLIDKKGRIDSLYAGAMTEDVFRQGVERLLAEAAGVPDRMPSTQR